VFPHAEAGPRLVYETALPFLNSKPARANLQEGAEFVQAPQGGDHSHGLCALAALRYVLRSSGLATVEVGAVYVTVLQQLATITQLEVAAASSISESGLVRIEMMVAQMARDTALHVQDQAQLQEVIQAVKQVGDQARALHARTMKTAPPKLEVKQGEGVDPEVGKFPLFGRLRRDGFDVSSLAGTIGDRPIIRPMELTAVADVVLTLRDAVVTLKNAVQVCTLMANQADAVKNTYMFRAALLVDLFTGTLPVPLAVNHPKKATDFWSQPMTRETQGDLLESLRMLSRHFACAAMSLTTTSAFDAARTLTFGCMAAMADAVLRSEAVDVPSMLALHYSGRAPGPVQPFAFDLMGDFEVFSAAMLFVDPKYCVARTQVLEYFSQLRATVPADHLVFAFDKEMRLGDADKLLMGQLTAQLGFSYTEKWGKYFTGEEPEVVENYPELAVFRDIVYMFKVMMAPTSDSLPKVKRWLPEDARLEWTFEDEGKQNDLNKSMVGRFKAEAFGMEMFKPGTWTSNITSGVSSAFTSIAGFFGGGGGGDDKRLPHSGADPSVVLGEKVSTEDDVLHVEKMPDFGGRVSAQDAELLASFLTAPYLRIPLVLNFFADEARVHALDSLDLQAIVTSSLFEPAEWQSEHVKALPDLIPPPTSDFAKTPCGLLLNEIAAAPDGVLEPATKLLDLALALNTGRYAEPQGHVILFVVRLTVRLLGYLKMVLQHAEWVEAGEAGVTGAGGGSHVRGLDVTSQVLEKVQAAHDTLQERLHVNVFKMLEAWRRKAGRAEAVSLAEMSILHAHLAYLFKYTEERELDLKTATVLLSSQIYLTHNYQYDFEASINKSKEVKKAKKAKKALKKDKKDKKLQTNSRLNLGDVDEGLLISQMEIFTLFQTHRPKLLRWLKANPLDADFALEATIRILTSGGSLEHLQTEQAPRHWKILDFQGSDGRFVPDTETLTAPGNELSFYEWLKYMTTQAVETEINIQMGTYTIKNNHTEMLDTDISSDPEFAEVFGEQTKFSLKQAVRVETTGVRKWLRLAAERHDVQFWTSKDDRPPRSPFHGRMVDSFTGEEDWVKATMAPFVNAELKELHFSFERSNVAQQPYAFGSVLYKGTLKEVMVQRSPRAVNVFNVVEHGRHFYRTLVWTSDVHNCLADFEPRAKVKYNMGE
jgi:hypothetical protein